MAEIWYLTNMTSNTAPPPLVASASANHTNGGASWGAFNGLPTGQWITPDNSGANQWIQIDYGEILQVDLIKLNARNDNFFYQNPYKFKIQYSLDNTTWDETEVIESHKFISVNDSFTYKLENIIKARYFRLYVTELFTGNNNISIGEIAYGYNNMNRLTIQNPIINKNYSLSDKALIHLPNTSNKNMISYGIEQGKEIQLDVPFSKHIYINDTPVGKVFTQGIESSNTLKMKELKKEEYAPIFTWYETRMTSNTAPSPLVASASSVYNDPRYLEYRAFNGTTADANDAFIFASGILTGWLQLDFGKNTQVSSIGITSINNSSSTTSTPKDMKLQGSLDGIAFEDIYTLPPQIGWNANETRTFNLGKKNNYRFYRLVVDSNNGYASYTAIGQLVFGSKREVN